MDERERQIVKNLITASQHMITATEVLPHQIREAVGGLTDTEAKTLLRGYADDMEKWTATLKAACESVKKLTERESVDTSEE